MRLQIIIDNMHHEIDTTDPKLLFKWVEEILGRMPMWHPSTMVRLQAWPSFLYNKESQSWEADWIQDSRILGQYEEVKDPDDWINALNSLRLKGIAAKED